MKEDQFKQFIKQLETAFQDYYKKALSERIKRGVKEGKKRKSNETKIV